MTIFVGREVLRSHNDVLEALGRFEISADAYHGTPGDGDCAATAAAQALLLETDLPEGAVLPAALASVEELRRHAAEQLRKNTVLYDEWTKEEARKVFIRQLNEHATTQLAEDAPDDAVLDLVEKKATTGGGWVSPRILSAMAVALGRTIVVVSSVSAVVYPATAGWYQWEDATDQAKWKSTAEGVYFGAATPEATGWLPAVALKAETLVIVFNQEDHFWCTRRSREHDARGLMARFGLERVRGFRLSVDRPSGV